MARIISDIRFGGGWATDFGPNFSGMDQSGIITVPWLVNADNILYELDGGVRKMGGGTRLNSSAITGATSVMGIYDYWRSGTAGSPAQKRMAYSSTVLWKEDLDGVFDSLVTGLEAGKVPCFGTFNDVCVFSTTSNIDVPRQYDQTTAANLSGTPPNFAFFTIHKNRGWAAGVATNPSRVYYTVLNNIQDWVGAGSGSIDISTNDGSEITGLWGDHKDVLWIFKGPQKLSIHYITGSSSSDFARIPFIRGIGASNHNSITPYGDDIAFTSHLGIHSLAATSAYGDFVEAFLSFPFNSYWQEFINLGQLSLSQVAHYRKRGIVVWTVMKSGSTQNDLLLFMDYRFKPVRWSGGLIPGSASLAVVVNNNVPELWAGDYGGFVLRLDRKDRNVADVAYTAKATLPYINLGSSHFNKTAAKVFVGLKPKGSYTLTVGWTRDNNAQQAVTVDQRGSGDVLGPTTVNQFVLDDSLLGGGTFITQPADLDGEFRDIQLEVTQAGLNQDMEVHSIGLHADRGGVMEESS